MRRIGEQEAKQGWKFTEQQLEGIFTAMNNNVTIIRGYGGTGKSSCVTGLLACADEDYRFKQCALSGKASVNLTDITGQEGYTIHRLLEVDPITGRFNHNEYFPLLTDLVILDEGSMVDVALFESLIQAIPTGAKLIILGDTNQLESIGVGNILLDMIDSGEVPVVTFDKVHRQGAKSAIIGESIKIAQGQKPVGYGWEGTNVLGELKDLKYIGFTCDRDSKKPTIDLIMKEFKTLYNECKDISQIAVIVPTRERGTGCLPINILIQDYVLPPLEKRGFYCNCGGYDIYKGDKVINLKNARPRPNQAIVSAPIYNGNMGEVIEVGFDYLKVDFYNIGEVYIYKSHLENIALGYAITVHKSQGSTIPYTISAIDFSHFSMLTRQLVYTTMTRAKKKCVMIFETNALIRAINTNKITQKDTFLYYFLTGELEM
jgi:RecD/TraA family predicted helicase